MSGAQQATARQGDALHAFSLADAIATLQTLLMARQDGSDPLPAHHVQPVLRYVNELLAGWMDSPEWQAPHLHLMFAAGLVQTCEAASWAVSCSYPSGADHLPECIWQTLQRALQLLERAQDTARDNTPQNDAVAGLPAQPHMSPFPPATALQPATTPEGTN